MSKQAMKISHLALGRATRLVDAAGKEFNQGKRDTFKPPEPPKGVIPADIKLAQDRADSACYDYLNGVGYGTYGSFTFLGFPLLAEMSQQPEYRMMTETLAKEATRKFIKITCASEDKAAADKVKAMEAAVKKYKVRNLFRKCSEHDGFFGRAQIFIDMGVDDAALKDPLLLSDKTIKKGQLRGFKTVEPIWTYPNTYNSTNPLAANYYRPEFWYVMSTQVHRTRLLTMVSRPVADILKPVYQFGGLSLTQLAQDYVNNFLRSRDSVSDTLHSYSLTYLKTNMGAILQGDGGDNLFHRLDLFNRMRDNRGVAAIDFETEEFAQLNTPLSGVPELQAASMEAMAGVAHLPLVKMFGITPSGLNASSEGEIQVGHEWTHSYQEDFYGDTLTTILEIIQLSEFGVIDPDIGYEFVPLWQMTEKELAEIRKSNGETDTAYINGGVLSPLDVRQKLANDPTSGYHGLDVDDLPPPPEPDDTGNDDEPPKGDE